MADDTPILKNIKLVETPPPESVFDNIEALRKTAVLKVARKVALVNVSVKKPPNNVYFRVYPNPDWTLDGSVVLGDGGSDDFYFVTPRMLNHHTMLPRLRKTTIVTVYYWPGGEVSLWPVPIVDDTTRTKCWKTARAAHEIAKEKWVQLAWNEGLRDYDVITAEGINMEPVWPADKTFQDLLRIGFADRIIDTENHPYVLRLRGLAE